MASLIERDTSGVLQARDSEKLHSRHRRAVRYKVSDNADGSTTYRIGASIGPLHYSPTVINYDTDVTEDTQWSQIDLTLLPVTDKSWQYECTTNGYQVRVWQRHGKCGYYTARFLRAGQWVCLAPLSLAYENDEGEQQVISLPVAGITPVIDNEANKICWHDCFGKGVHWAYNLCPDKFFKTVTVDSPDCLPLPTISRNGLRLIVLVAISWSGDAVKMGGRSNLSVLLDSAPDDKPDEILDAWDAFAVLRPDDMRAALWMYEPCSWDAVGNNIPMNYKLQRYTSKRGLVGAFSVAIDDLARAVWPVSIDTAITEEQVGANSDDAHDTGTNFYDYNYVPLSASGARNSGFRFTSVPIPKQSEINSASLKVHGDDSYSADDPKLTLYGDAATNSGTFTSSSMPSDRTTTTHSVSWVDTNLGQANWWTSPDISEIVEEIVAIDGWASGNALSILGRAVVGSTGATCEAYNDVAANAAKFNCTYTAASSTSSIPVIMNYYRRMRG